MEYNQTYNDTLIGYWGQTFRINSLFWTEATPSGQSDSMSLSVYKTGKNVPHVHKDVHKDEISNVIVMND